MEYSALGASPAQLSERLHSPGQLPDSGDFYFWLQQQEEGIRARGAAPSAAEHRIDLLPFLQENPGLESQ